MKDEMRALLNVRDEPPCNRRTIWYSHEELMFGILCMHTDTSLRNIAQIIMRLAPKEPHDECDHRDRQLKLTAEQMHIQTFENRCKHPKWYWLKAIELRDTDSETRCALIDAWDVLCKAEATDGDLVWDAIPPKEVSTTRPNPGDQRLNLWMAVLVQCSPRASWTMIAEVTGRRGHDRNRFDVQDIKKHWQMLKDQGGHWWDTVETITRVHEYAQEVLAEACALAIDAEAGDFGLQWRELNHADPGNDDRSGYSSGHTSQEGRRSKPG